MLYHSGVTNLYKVDGPSLTTVSRKHLEKEDDLQRWIAENSRLIGMDILVLGREVAATSGRIDILAIDSDGKLVVIECKRDRTPRDVIAQILDYASWVNDLSERELDEIAVDKTGKHLDQLFQDRFQTALPEKLNSGHSLVIVCSEFDSSSKRIVEYLAEVHGVAINTVFFSTFEHQGQTLIATNWLMDQEEVTTRAESKEKIAWPGLWYVNVGEGEHRSWEDMREFGFLAAGHGKIYSDALRKIKPGDPVLAYQKGYGYVGYGVASSAVVPVQDFLYKGEPVLEAHLIQPGLSMDADDPDLSEYLIGVEWQKTFPVSQAKTFPGIFANPNIVCKLRDTATVNFLRKEFSIEGQ
ncbi:MAG: endonuclease NucS [Terracidiphilus sp.]|nr:endonuclease NucS [Terracidiphilus sp.]